MRHCRQMRPYFAAGLWSAHGSFGWRSIVGLVSRSRRSANPPLAHRARSPNWSPTSCRGNRPTADPQSCRECLSFAGVGAEAFLAGEAVTDRSHLAARTPGRRYVRLTIIVRRISARLIGTREQHEVRGPHLCGSGVM
jgi:hypothetical protein